MWELSDAPAREHDEGGRGLTTQLGLTCCSRPLPSPLLTIYKLSPTSVQNPRNTTAYVPIHVYTTIFAAASQQQFVNPSISTTIVCQGMLAFRMRWHLALLVAVVSGAWLQRLPAAWLGRRGADFASNACRLVKGAVWAAQRCASTKPALIV